MDTLSAIPSRFWLLTLACAAGFAGLWWSTLGHRRWQRRRTLQRSLAALGAGAGRADLPPLPALAAAPAAARDTRLLFIGDALANMPRLFDAGLAVPRENADPDAPWRSWALPAMTAIVLNPAIACEAADPRWRGAWLRCIAALAEQRPATPLNGIVVCVDASHLAAAPAALGPLVREAARLLRLHLPVYIVVCGLERLEGHSLACAALPAGVRAQAVGHRLSARESASAATATARLDAIYTPMSARLEALGAALLRDSTEPAARLAIHRWIEQLIGLQPGLQALATQLFEQPSDAAWRGLYLAAAATPDGPGAFTDDLFQRFLPDDQAMARAGPAPA